MTETAPTQDKRCRGRPQLRPDEETRAIIHEVARHVFAESGFAATSMETVAKRAGVSTKTLYRLIPNKAALFEGMVTDRLDRFLLSVDLRSSGHADIEDALIAALLACTDLVLDPEVVALQQIMLQEGCRFPDIAQTFYRNGIQRSQTTLANWLRAQQQRGLITLDNADDAAGMLLGMVASAPRRATIFGGEALPSRQEIERRVRTCAAIFLRGVRADKG